MPQSLILIFQKSLSEPIGLKIWATGSKLTIFHKKKILFDEQLFFDNFFPVQNSNLGLSKDKLPESTYNRLIPFRCGITISRSDGSHYDSSKVIRLNKKAVQRICPKSIQSM